MSAGCMVCGVWLLLVLAPAEKIVLLLEDGVEAPHLRDDSREDIGIHDGIFLSGIVLVAVSLIPAWTAISTFALLRRREWNCCLNLQTEATAEAAEILEIKSLSMSEEEAAQAEEAAAVEPQQLFYYDRNEQNSTTGDFKFDDHEVYKVLRVETVTKTVPNPIFDWKAMEGERGMRKILGIDQLCDIKFPEPPATMQ